MVQKGGGIFEPLKVSRVGMGTSHPPHRTVRTDFQYTALLVASIQMLENPLLFS
jgi:hypothetical protein